MVGDEDRIVPPKLGWRLASSLPHGELLALPNVGHVPQFEATSEALAALERFLAQHAPNAKRR
jgi:pimeloyl-ACP methyl ester carboxylesterase